MGRPSKYNQKTATEILDRIAEGESLHRICKDKGMPARSTVLKWCIDIPEFSDHYARAYQIGADVEFDEIQELAATATPENAQVVKLQVDTRKWVLSKKLPKKYGDKVQQEVSGPNGGPVEVSKIERTIVDPQ